MHYSNIISVRASTFKTETKFHLGSQNFIEKDCLRMTLEIIFKSFCNISLIYST